MGLLPTTVAGGERGKEEGVPAPKVLREAAPSRQKILDTAWFRLEGLCLCTVLGSRAGKETTSL